MRLPEKVSITVPRMNPAIAPSVPPLTYPRNAPIHFVYPNVIYYLTIYFFSQRLNKLKQILRKAHQATQVPMYYLFVYSCYYAARTAIVAELAEVYALPCTKIEMSVCNRYCDAYTEERAFGMGWHIVRAFKYMIIVRLVFFHDMVHYLLHVISHIRICVLVYRQGARCVLHKEIEQSYLWKRSR